MQSNDTRMLRGAALPTAVVGLGALLVASVAVGQRGALSAIIGTLLVTAFFGLGLYALARVGERWPELLLGAAMAIYTTQILLMLIPLALLRDASFVHQQSFGFTVLACLVTWLVGQTWMQTRVKTPYVQIQPSDTEPQRERQP